MKKIFTLLFTIGLFSMAQAQSVKKDKRDKDDRRYEQRDRDDNDDDDDDDDRYKNKDKKKNKAKHKHKKDNENRYEENNGRRNGNHNGNNRFGDERQMRLEIEEVNRKYDYQVQQVRNDRYLGSAEKEKQIRRLENKRTQEINRIQKEYKSKQRFEDRDAPVRRNRF